MLYGATHCAAHNTACEAHADVCTNRRPQLKWAWGPRPFVYEPADEGQAALRVESELTASQGLVFIADLTLQHPPIPLQVLHQPPPLSDLQLDKQLFGLAWLGTT